MKLLPSILAFAVALAPLSSFAAENNDIVDAIIKARQKEPKSAVETAPAPKVAPKKAVEPKPAPKKADKPAPIAKKSRSNIEAERERLEAEKKKLAAEKRKFEAERARLEAEKAEFEAARKPMAEEPAPALEEPDNGKAVTLEFQMSGFVDMAYSNVPNDETNTFGIDQVELDFESRPANNTSARLDLHFAPSGTGALEANDIVEQAYIEIDLSPITLTFGKFNAPIGAEGGEPTEMFQYSYAEINNVGIPGDLTGIMLTLSQEVVELNLYVVNGNDMALGTNADDNIEKTAGAHLAISPMENLGIGFSYIAGKEGAKPNQKMLAVYDVDFNYSPIEALTLVAQYNGGSYEDQSQIASEDEKWTGYLVKGHYDFTDWFGITARWDSITDKGGERLGGTVGGTAVKETRDAATIAGTFVISENLGSVIEYKSQKSDKKVFTASDGVTPKSSQDSFAAELTYSF